MKTVSQSHPCRPRRLLAAWAGWMTLASCLAATPALAQTAGSGGAAAAKATSATTLSKAELIERGKYIVSTSGCHDCHTPWHVGPNGPEPDMRLALSGHPQSLVMPPAPKLPEGPWLVTSSGTNTAYAGPWGVSFTANLTPDKETGMGKWSVQDFIDTIRTGRRMGRGREILPPMPYPVYRNMTDTDLTAVYTYLMSMPAISNRVPEPRPPEASLATGKP